MNNEPEKKVFCTECGHPNRYGSKFCSNCGNKLSAPRLPDPKPQESEVPVIIPVVEEPTLPEPMIEEPITVEDPIVIADPIAKEDDDAFVPVILPLDEPVEDEPIAQEPEAVEEPVAQEEAAEENDTAFVPVILPLDEPVEDEPIAQEPEAVEEPLAQEEAAEEEDTAFVPVILPLDEPVEDEPLAQEPEAVEEPVAQEEAAEEEDTAFVPVILPLDEPVEDEPLVQEPEAVEEPTPAAPTSDMLYCEMCGTPHKRNARFCISCGNKFDTSNIIPVVPIIPPEEKQVSKEDEYIPPESQAVDPDPQPEPEQKRESESESEKKEITEDKKEKKENKKNKKTKAKQNVFLKILSVFFAVILAVLLIASTAVTLLHTVISPDNTQNLVADLIDSIDLDDLYINTPDGKLSIGEYFIQSCQKNKGWENVTENDLEDTLEEEYIHEFASEIINEYLTEFVENDGELNITAEDIYDILESNDKTIKKMAKDLGFEGNLQIKEKKDTIISNIEKQIGQEGINIKLNVEAIGGSAVSGLALQSILFIFTDIAMIAMWGIVAVFALIIFFINWGYFGNFLRSCGIPALIIGVIYLIASLCAEPLSQLFKLPDTAIGDAITFAIGYIAAILLEMSIVLAAVAVGLIIISVISDAIARKIRNNNA